MNEWNELEAVLQKCNYTYINDWGIMFTRVDAGLWLIDGPWPEHNCVDIITLAYLCNNPSDFFSRLEIENPQQLEQVKADVLLKLFHAGEVILACTVGDHETLEFRINEGKLIAYKEDSQILHVVKPHLEAPEHFIEYTKQFFSKLNEVLAVKN